MTKERIVHIQEATMTRFIEKVIQLHENGFKFKDGRVIGSFKVANFVKEEEEDVTVDATKNPQNTQGTVDKPTEEVPVEGILAKAGEITDKGELEAFGRTHGVELSRRKSLKNMLKELEEALTKE